MVFKLDRDIQKHDAAASRANVLRLDSRTKFQVFVKGFVTMTFDVDRNTTVAQLKSRLQERTGIPAAIQRLTAGGKPIVVPDGSLQQHYNLQNNTTIILNVNPFEYRK